jgi:hypothetical protein
MWCKWVLLVLLVAHLLALVASTVLSMSVSKLTGLSILIPSLV